MAKKRFECEVIRKDNYIIEFNDEVITEEWMKDFRKTFYDFKDLKEHAEHIAQDRARNGEGFIEGYGKPYVDGEPMFSMTGDSSDDNKGINIIVESEDDDIEVVVMELKSEETPRDDNFGCF